MDLFDKLTATLWQVIAVLVIVAVILLITRLLVKKPLRVGGQKRITVKETLKDSGLATGHDPDGFIYGKIRSLQSKKVYQSYQNEGHIAVFGAPGTGKTSALLIPSLRAWKGTSLCIDISGDISRNVPCDHKCVLAPDDLENSMIYNVFDQIDQQQSGNLRHEMLEQLVDLIIPIPPTAKDAQEYFLRTARKIFLAAMIAFYDRGDDFIPICQKIFFSGCEALFEQISDTGNQLACAYIGAMANENEKNISGAKSTLDDHIKLFATNDNMKHILRRPADLPNGSVEPYLAPGDLEQAHIFLVVPDRKQEYYSMFLSIVVSQMLAYISQRSYTPGKDKRILLALDEFASLQHLDIMGPMRKFRKNGANICILTQSLADIDLVYSRDERKVILDNAAYIVVLSARDNDTRVYFSDLVGKQDVRKESVTSSRSGDSTSTSYAQEYVIHPNEWQTMGDDLIVIHRSGYVRLKKNFYFEQ